MYLKKRRKRKERIKSKLFCVYIKKKERKKKQGDLYIFFFDVCVTNLANHLCSTAQIKKKNPTLLTS
jgi:hypothetical protein